MQQLPKEFVGRMVRTVLFIGLVAACCAGVATFGMFVASKFNLTTSRNQVPLTSVKIEGEKVLIPENGKTTREAGWTLRNSRGQYILTLDELEAGSLDTAEPVIEVEGDLILQLKKDTISHLESQGPVIKKGTGTLTIREKEVWNWSQQMRKQSAVTGMGRAGMQITPPLSVWKPEILLLQGQDLVLWMRQ